MRPMTKKNKIAAVAASAALVAVGGSAAYAYWSTTGSGSGQAKAATTTNAVVIHVAFDENITPGSSKTISYTADNPNSGSTPVTLTGAVVTASGSCDASWFAASVPTGTKTLAGNATNVDMGTGTLTFSDSTLNQDACKGATITVTASSN
ncbi:hypothetical protein [Arthrobacter sp. Soil761]|uniref:hypothetical protein n=1 Tax=Arthrobacter sp. Soil761 TaxID=1736400 RepID=UPI000A96FC0A|nr:hypothetical protein [Arthrobacter sp. Soil761]